MEFKICCKTFWEKTGELYAHDIRHIKGMDDKNHTLGLKYKDTDYLDRTTIIGFIFEVIDEKKFILAKLKYGF